MPSLSDLGQRHGDEDEKYEECVQKPIEDVEEVEIGGSLDDETEAMVYEDVSGENSKHNTVKVDIRFY